MSPQEFLQALRQTLGAEAVLSGDAVPARYHTDWSGTPPVAPLALVRPRSTEDVSATLRLCHQHRVPVVPQGGLTGLAGAAVPSADCVALSLERMPAIEAIDARSATMTVQAGATLQAVQEAAVDAGLAFGVDLGARGSCQIGGNVATNAGGNGVLQHGMMREQVLGLEVVLADGTVLPMLRPMLKNNTGYDLKQFFIGAEGTLGVITRVLLRLRPLPQAKATALVALPGFDQALAVLQRMQGRFGNSVAAFELMWDNFVQASVQWQQLQAPLAERHPLLALIDVDGKDEASLREAVEAVLGDAMEAGEVVDAVIAQSQTQAKTLWKLREAPAELNTQMHPPVNFDVSLPQAEIGRFAAAIQAAFDARWPGHHTLFFGHVGDGNLHVSTDGATVGGACEAVEAELYRVVGAFHGSVSAEHGIGLHKKPFLALSRTPQELAAMRAIKAALDPLGLMNPGKVF
ncbi:FAD-binding oxidoreductase [Comamonas aquatica]|uniref:FAD-binding oxidoreductase n=1 Tax=Comamonas aquatica TaxID=225991 RepID=UPI0022DDC241|nr:FAD-binding oxidoreductase [Comamonas aquatica]MDH0201203.1 FAD-binding oxidoreductase [Comamonas aquatica]MDH0494453.1 FAD-binding oxidoreductase [Comamonas aquatica]MDH1446269.1 FAD-binding oxidoreductase [Comamonas aquatica]MDH1902755.1 FAD-binding oxidoreductase [Comamonas aquatica]WBM42174.1 FAD-binding oxidoreductase [Comamonas aquatica]